MVPLILLNGISHLFAYWLSSNYSWLWAGILIFSVGPYTKFVLMEDIDGLRKAEGKDVVKMTKSFCHMHHLRLVAAATGFFISLNALASG
ncbi:unnamed protein product [Choristocarpus tenellus]